MKEIPSLKSNPNEKQDSTCLNCTQYVQHKFIYGMASPFLKGKQKFKFTGRLWEDKKERRGSEKGVWVEVIRAHF